VDLQLLAEKSVFVVFRRTAATSADRLAAIEARGDGTIGCDPDGRPVIGAIEPASGSALFASGHRRSLDLKPGPTIPLPGPWLVELAPAVGSPRDIALETLASLAEHPDPEVRYFSGTATYRVTVALDASMLGAGQRLLLDLGDVRDLVRVVVNGSDFGVIWHPPFVRDVTEALRPGPNTLELAVTNTWHNRLVGDEQEPPDFEWGTDRGVKLGRALKSYPDWFISNQPRPSAGRKAFVNWFYHRSDTPLIPSGLLGPVRLMPQAVLRLQP
jgi:hypothetical protein